MVPLLIEVQRPAAGKRTSLIENPRPSVANSSIIQFPAKVFNLFHIKSESAEGWNEEAIPETAPGTFIPTILNS